MEQPKTSSDGSAMTLLIVEDDVPLARALCRELERRGLAVTLKHSGADARAVDGTFDCCILDIDLPDDNGLWLGQALKARASVKRLVFFSGSYDEDVRASAERLGMFVEKRQGFSAVLHAIFGISDAPKDNVSDLQVGSAGEGEGGAISPSQYCKLCR